MLLFMIFCQVDDRILDDMLRYTGYNTNRVLVKIDRHGNEYIDMNTNADDDEEVAIRDR